MVSFPAAMFLLARVVEGAQTVYTLARGAGMLDAMTDHQRLALYVAALCHDLDHPVGPCLGSFVGRFNGNRFGAVFSRAAEPD